MHTQQEVGLPTLLQVTLKIRKQKQDDCDTNEA